jgi:hypothetical protein
MATAASAPPFIYTKPTIRIGDVTTGVEIQCSATHCRLGVDQDENTVETFCGVFTSYKAEKWVLEVTAANSYGTTGLWTLLRPLCGTIVEFGVLPANGTAISASNPEATGTGYLKGFDFIDADPGGASEVSIVLGIQGVPTFDSTP